VLAVTGAMPLTVYVAHALLWTAWSGRVGGDLVTATVLGGAFLATMVVATNVWARAGRGSRSRRGPLEAAVHAISHLGGSGADGSRARSAAPVQP